MPSETLIFFSTHAVATGDDSIFFCESQSIKHEDGLWQVKNTNIFARKALQKNEINRDSVEIKINSLLLLASKKLADQDRSFRRIIVFIHARELGKKTSSVLHCTKEDIPEYKKLFELQDENNIPSFIFAFKHSDNYAYGFLLEAREDAPMADNTALEIAFVQEIELQNPFIKSEG